jgi:CubicO group peptidase (beta-lactamase class C family)
MRASLPTRTMLVFAIVQLTSLPVFAQQNDADARLQTAVANLEQRAQKQVDEHAVVGMAIGVVHKDKLIFAKGFGPRETGKPAAIDADTAFQLASVSKPVGATVVAALVGDGKITWDSRLSDLDPSFRMFDDYVTREITIRDMYAHRSGLPEHAGDLLEDLGYDRGQVLHRLRYQKPDSSFRSHYAYTNFGLTEGGVAAAKAYGLTWEDASQEKLYKPLGMTATSSRYADFVARANHAPGHVLVDGKWVQKYSRQPDAQSPAGGVSSSVNDLAKWMRLRLANGKFEGKQIVDEKALLETQSPQMFTHFSPLNGLPTFYGLGMNVNWDEQGRLRLGHSGAFALGNATAISMVPSEQLGIIVLTNSYPVGVAETMTATFVDDALYGKQTTDWVALFKKIFSDPATLGLDTGFQYAKTRPTAPSAALSNAAYVGNFGNELFGDISVVEAPGGLELVAGPHGMRFPLRHYDRDTFTYLPPGENSPGVSGVNFRIAPDGKATSVMLENLNEYGQGIFRRPAP